MSVDIRSHRAPRAWAAYPNTFRGNFRFLWEHTYPAKWFSSIQRELAIMRTEPPLYPPRQRSKIL